jgi:hypothetical protein
MAIDIENAVNTLYGTAPISDAPGVEAAEQTVDESQQTIADLTEVVSSELPEPEAVLPEPPQVLTPEDFGTAAAYVPTFTIDNYTNFNITKLRTLT